MKIFYCTCTQRSDGTAFIEGQHDCHTGGKTSYLCWNLSNTWTYSCILCWQSICGTLLMWHHCESVKNCSKLSGFSFGPQITQSNYTRGEYKVQRLPKKKTSLALLILIQYFSTMTTWMAKSSICIKHQRTTMPAEEVDIWKEGLCFMR